ncbi:MAG TPA: restriction endonuclease subunit S [Pantanalinema sp.]
MTDLATKLPTGWAEASLGELTTKLVDGSHNPPKEADFGFPMLSARNIDEGQIQFTKYRFISEQSFKVEHARTQVSPGDVLLTIVGTIGRTAIVPHSIQPFTLQRSVAVLAPQGVIPEFLKFQLDSPIIQTQLEAEAKGTAQKGIYLKALAGIKLRVAPLNEQRHIVTKITELTARSHRAREALDAIPALLDRFRQSVLAAAFRGDLTAEWRAKNPDVEPASVLLDRIRQERYRKWEKNLRTKGKDPSRAKYEDPLAPESDGLPSLPEGWCWATVDELAVLTQYGSSAKTYEDPSGIPVLRMGNIVDGTLLMEGLKYLPADHDEFPELFLEAGDILFNRTNSPELVGKTAVFEGADGPVSFASYLIRVRVRGCLPQIVSMYINSPFGRAWVGENINQQVGQANINGSKLRALTIPVPPLEEQRHIVAVVERALMSRGQVRETVGITLDGLETLTQSILAKAFRGELVPQDPNDEPASALLDRIRGERAEAVVPKARRGRKPRELTEARG